MPRRQQRGATVAVRDDSGSVWRENRIRRRQLAEKLFPVNQSDPIRLNKYSNIRIKLLTITSCRVGQNRVELQHGNILKYQSRLVNMSPLMQKRQPLALCSYVAWTKQCYCLSRNHFIPDFIRTFRDYFHCKADMRCFSCMNCFGRWSDLDTSDL